MFYFVLLALLVIAMVVGFVLSENRTERIVSVVAGVVLILAVTGIFSYNSVGNGQVGLVKGLGGQIVSQTAPNAGAVFVAPWHSVTVANVKTQASTFKLDSFSSETQDVFVTATLNYNVAPKDILSLYKTVGANWFNVLVPTRVNQAFKDETVKFKAVDIAPNRDTIRKDVLARLKNELAAFSINVDDLNIDNISFSPAFTNAIEAKQIATQEAQAARNRVAQAQYQAAALIAAARGQAKANLLKQRTLTPLLVQQNAIDKLNPNVQVMVVDSKSILNLGSLLGTK